MTIMIKPTRKAHSEEGGHLTITLKLRMCFPAARSLYSRLCRKWRWIALLSCQRAKNSNSKKLTKILTNLIQPNLTQIMNSSKKEQLMRLLMPWRITTLTAKPQGRSKRRISPTSRRDKNSIKMLRWSERLKCARISFTLENANSALTALTPTPRTSYWKKGMFKATTWPSSALNFTITNAVSATTEKDVNSFIPSTIEERKSAWCKDYTRELDWQCWELSKLVTLKEPILSGLT